MEAGGNQIYTQDKGRIIGFDCIRSIAICLTLCRHSFPPSNFLWQIGWIGVHLFFILSSFLIADILFTEFYKNGKVDFYRFFIRRSLKIYPLYYLFILVSVFKNREFFLSSIQHKMQLLGQIFHLQNYTDIIWYHTWSLAAEEHFYIGMCIILSIYLYFSKSGKLDRLIFIFIGVILLVPLFRYQSTIIYKTDWFMATHLIMDSFAFGALLAICKFVYPSIFSAIIGWKHYLLIPIFLLLIPVFVLPTGNLVLNSIGMSMMYLSFATLIGYLLSIENLLKQNNRIFKTLINPLASIGIASYSIYLLHVPVKTFVDAIPMSGWLRIPIYFIACMLIGKITWYLIERPIALYKSRFFAQEKR